MNKVFAMLFAVCFMSVYVTQASPQVKHGDIKCEFSQSINAIDAPAYMPITCHHFTLPDVILVPEPCYTNVTISYCFVAPILNPTQGITSRCNSPPFY